MPLPPRQRVSVSSPEDRSYYERELAAAQARPEPLAALALAALGRQPTRVLDVGCGAGQVLAAFASGSQVAGVDPSSSALGLAREHLTGIAPSRTPWLCRSGAEQMPFVSGAFDLVTSRLVLPYTDNLAALDEMTRVLAPAGVLVLKVHHLRYYLRQLRTALRARDLRSLLHAGRVIAFGAVFELTGRQLTVQRPSGPMREVFQLVGSLRRRLGDRGFEILGVEDARSATPTVVARKRTHAGA